MSINQARRVAALPRQFVYCRHSLSGKTLSTSQIWWNGPSFLQLPEVHWPRAEESAAITHVLLNTKLGELRTINLDKVMDCERYSSYNKLLRVTVRILNLKTYYKGPRLTREKRCLHLSTIID